MKDYRMLKILNESTLLLVTPSGKECKRNFNDVKPCTTLELIENAWNSFLNSIKLTITIIIITWDLMTKFNTYNMNSITASSLPTNMKYLHQSLQVKQHYLYTYELNTYLIQMQFQQPKPFQTVTSTTLMTQQTLLTLMSTQDKKNQVISFHVTSYKKFE